MTDWCSPHRPILLVVFGVFSLSLWTPARSDFRICTYNVENFNYQKASNGKVLHALAQVVSHCDICLLQHVVDSQNKAINALLARLSSRTVYRYSSYHYKSLSSAGLGKSPDDMQQYVFLYRPLRVNVTGHYQYQGNLTFDRAPFIVKFQSSKTTINEFILIPLHSNPEKAVQEIDQLYDIFEEVSKKWNNENVMFLGDFHASCGYVTRDDRKNIRLFMNSNFSWLIEEREDTTVSDSNNCAYDRIVVHGKSFSDNVVPGSGKVFNFGEQFKYRKSEVLQLSNHYPLEVTLKSSASLLQASRLLNLLSASVILWFFISTV